jgi:membrane fusion protein
VKQVSSAVINPSDLNIGVQMSDPVYRVIVGIDKQSIDAYGQVFHLQSGMTLQADIVAERVILWELLFEPLLARIRSSHS